MYASSLLFLIILTFIAFIPVYKLYQYRDYSTFTPLRNTVSVVFVWSALTTFKFIVTDDLPTLGYYIHLVSFAVVLLIAMNFYNTIMQFIGKPLSRLTKMIGYLYLALFSVLLLLNDVFHLLIVEGSERIEGLTDVLGVNVTPLFYVHVLIAYLLLIVPIAVLLVYLRTRKKKDLYKVPFRFFLGGLLIGLISNYIHLFVYTFYVDPTLVVIVLFAYSLFHLIYKRDMGFILMSESRKTLIENMREMYIVTDEEGLVIDCSSELKNRFLIDRYAHVDSILKALQEKAMLYESINTVKDKSQPIPYLYTIRKPLKLDKTGLRGSLYLFYDETRLIKMMEKLEYLQAHDSMTGLYNRNYFEQQLAFLQEKYDKAVVLIADVNGLKLFNDHFGHKEGDRLILRFTDILNATTRNLDDTFLMRIGGDEFLVFMGNASEADANALKDAIKAASYHEDPLKAISTSIGFAVREKGENLETTFLRADHALYTIKRKTSKAYREAFMEAYRNQYESEQ